MCGLSFETVVGEEFINLARGAESVESLVAVASRGALVFGDDADNAIKHCTERLRKVRYVIDDIHDPKHGGPGDIRQRDSRIRMTGVVVAPGPPDEEVGGRRRKVTADDSEAGSVQGESAFADAAAVVQDRNFRPDGQQ